MYSSKKSTKWKIIATVAVLGLLSMSANLSAQGPCVPDCPGDLFGPVQTVIIPWPPDNPIANCNVVVQYRERLACGWWRDIYIEDATLLASGCPQVLQDIVNGSGGDAQQQIAEMMELGAIAAIAERFWNEYDPNTDDCPGQNTNNWRVLRGGCFAYGYTLPCFCELVTTPCTDELCCLVQYTVCYDRLNGEIDITPNYPEPQFTECGDEVADPTGLQLVSYGGVLCFPTCFEPGR